uniref:glucuronosyltransferase n=1 Tax=Parastrongyloides trichosuri TaxID=131310 RepID=A0A0N4Z614_PARTI
MNSLSFVLFIVANLFLSAHNLRILVYSPKLGHSHINFNGKIADILVKAGHDVTFLAPEIGDVKLTNGTKLAKIISIKPHPEVSEEYSKMPALLNPWVLKDDIKSAYVMFTTLSDMFYNSCEHLLNQEEITKQLRDSKFDVMIAEYFSSCPMGLVEYYNIPSLIITSAMTMNDVLYPLIGLNFPSSYVPGSFMPFNEEMSYKERIINTIQYGSLSFYLQGILFKRYEKLFYKKGNIKYYDGLKRVGAVFINTVPWVDFPFPTTTKVHFIGGSAIPVANKLSKKWDDLLSMKKTNILISFGSVAEAHKMPDKYKKGIIETMKNFSDITFIWKYEKGEETLPLEISENVILSKWIPQVDLLADKRIKIFITHGGMNSITEALAIGKVTIAIPVFGDQIRNAKMIERLNVSVSLNKKNLEDSVLLSEKIEYLLNNYDIYSKNAERQKNLMKDRPFKADETLIKMTEFIGKHGPIPEMSLYSENMNFFIFYNLDIYIPLLFILISMFVASILILKFIFKRLFFNNENVKKIKNE